MLDAELRGAVRVTGSGAWRSTLPLPSQTIPIRAVAISKNA